MNDKTELEYLHLMLNAWYNGEVIERQHKTNPRLKWNIWSEDGTIEFDKAYDYRIKPKETPLPIPDELWGYINPVFKYVAMDSDGCICFYRNKPHIGVDQANWYEENYSSDQAPSLITINTDGIDWKTSLTKRPEGL